MARNLQDDVSKIARLPLQFPSLRHLGLILQNFDECIFSPQSGRGQVVPGTTVQRQYDPMTERVYDALQLMLFQYLRGMDSNKHPLPKLKTFSLLREDELRRVPSIQRSGPAGSNWCTRMRPTNLARHPYSDWVSLRPEDLPSWRLPLEIFISSGDPGWTRERDNGIHVACLRVGERIGGFL